MSNMPSGTVDAGSPPESETGKKRIILEMGTSNDLYGEDYTKAALRAVQDALHHSSLILFRSLDLDHADMEVRVTIGVQKPDRVDTDAVAASLPRGQASVSVVKGGLNVPHEDGSVSVVATAAVAAYVDIPEGRWKLVGG